jgi:xanthine dehydrogenase YagS FAD-binding subunit
MNRFSYIRAESLDHAMAALSANPEAQIVAGGTNLVDLMKYEVATPSQIIDINGLPLKDIEELDDGGFRIGALVSNTTIAYNPAIQERLPLLSSAILAGASPQLRNVATTGGNLNQRTRCYYFYDPSTPCNKRQPGSGCSAIGGVNRIHAILGTSATCIATHPSDMCVGLAALDAVVEVAGPDGTRDIPFADYHRLPGDVPERDNTLICGELVTAVRIERPIKGVHHTYLKLRDRLSYAFALVAVAVSLDVEDGVICGARIALGGVAHKPWRDTAAEIALVGQSLQNADFEGFANAVLATARGQGSNDFKIPLAHNAIVRALTHAASGTPQVQSVKSIA